MPRANRVFVPGHVWHLTQRCHGKAFLLRAREDRRRWLWWLFEARRRYDLCVLDYIVTCNHVHLLVRDRGHDEIASSMQLVAGRTAQAYNDRKRRVGAFWQDRYHATAVESDAHLLQCITYIDLNMVRAGVVSHPSQWRESGFAEIQRAPARYRIIDTDALCRLTNCSTPGALRARLANRVSAALGSREMERQAAWTESLAVGNEPFLQSLRQSLGPRAAAREVADSAGISCLRERAAIYRLQAGATPARRPSGRTARKINFSE